MKKEEKKSKTKTTIVIHSVSVDQINFFFCFFSYAFSRYL